ncbi:MAG: hypothetical protein F4Z38_11190 [Chloroflexi bacterium]|nr:hypothetical protein [Chloroflexota bacterium]
MTVCGLSVRLPRAAGLTLCACSVLVSIHVGLAQGAPVVDSSSVDGSTLTITFSESLTASSTAVASEFAVKHGEESVSVSSAEVVGAVVTLTLTEAVPDVDCSDESVSVGFSPGSSSLIGVGGGTIEEFSDQSVANLTDAAPRIDSIASDTTGRYIYVTFCEAIADLSYQWSDFSAFTVSVDGVTRPVNDLLRRSDSGNRLDIQLSRSQAITEGESVTLAYDQRRANADYPLADLDQGNQLVESWAARSVTNNVDGPPALQTVSALYEVVTLTFSEQLDEDSVPDASAFTIGGIQNVPAVDDVTVSGQTVTLALDGILPSRDSPTYTLSYLEPNQAPLRQLDGAHNVADIFSFQFMSSTPDRKPAFSDAAVDGSLLTITFDLPLKAVAPASAFTIAGEVEITVTAAAFAGSLVTLTLSPAVTVNSSITVSYSVPDAPPRIEARNNRDADAFRSQPVTNRTSAPVPEFSRAETSADGTRLTIDFTLPLDATAEGTPAASSFSLSGTTASVSSVTVSGSSVTLGLAPLADVSQAIMISYTPPEGESEPRLRSLAHQKVVEAFSGQPVTNSTDGKPRPLSATATEDQIEITFDRPLDNRSEPAASTFALGGVAAAVSDISIEGKTLTLTVHPEITHRDSITVGYTQPAETPLKRAGSSLMVDSFVELGATNNTEDPTPTFRSASVDAAGRTLTIVMSHALLATSAGTPAASTFALIGSTSAVVESVKINGSSIELTLSPLADLNETVSVSYQPPSDATASALQSLDGDWKTAAWSNESVSNSADGVPRPVGATANGRTIALTFDRDLDETSVPPKADFSIAPREIVVSGVDIDDDTVNLTLSTALQHDDDVSVTYSAADDIKLKRDGHELAVSAFDEVEVTNETPEPLLRSIVGNEQAIVVSFSRSLDANSTPATSAFSLGADQPIVSEVTVNAMTVDLTLDRALSEGAAYTLTYTAPSDSPLTASDASEIPGFSKSVTNQTDVAPRAISATGDGSTVTIGFDQSLDDGSSLTGSALSISADPGAAATAVSYVDASIELTLSRPLAEDESASISYMQPSTGGIADPSGNRTESFAITVDNRTDTAPVPVSGTVEGDTVTITLDQELAAASLFDLDLDDNSVVLDHFTLTGTAAEDTNVIRVVVSNGGPNNVGKIVLTLSRETREGEALTITYFPKTGSIRIRDDDDGKNRVEISGYALTNLNDEPPVVESAMLDGTSLVVTFDQELDADSTPDVSAFSLSADGPAISTASIAGAVLTLTLATTAIEDAEYQLTYTPPVTDRIRDPTGNDAVGFSRDVDNATDYAPTPVSIETNQAGTEVSVRFDQAVLIPDTFEKTSFSFDTDEQIHSVIVDPNVRGSDQLILILESDSAIREGAVINLEYEPPTSGGLRDDDAGNLLESFTEPVDNTVDVAPLLTEATVNRDSVSLRFDQPLDTDHVPPANCDQLPIQSERAACHEVPDIAWFRITRDATEELEVEEVKVSGSVVELVLRNTVSRNAVITLAYARESLADGTYNLRDTSMPHHPVASFGPIQVTNLTAAAALEVAFDRLRPDRIEVSFDGPLSKTATDGRSLVTVSVDETPVDVESVNTDGSNLTLKLKQPVTECAPVSLTYVPGDAPLLDIDGREVVAFAFQVANLLNPQWGLSCLQSDVGALQLTFTDLSLLQRQGFEWQLTVNEQDRAFRTEESERALLLRPAKSICEGDITIVRYSSDLSPDRFQLERTIRVAAPCALSASADGERLSITFDGQLDGSPADLSGFSISGRASLEAVEGVEEQVLKLKLTPPGLPEGDNAEISYEGDSLVRGELTVGPFVLPVLDRTGPPELESAFALNTSVFLQFDQPLIARSVPASRFILSGPGIDAQVSSVSLTGSAVYIELSDQLPDDPDLFGLVYLAGTRGGLAGLTGSRVPDSVFIVRNYTETPPTVLSAEADSSEIELTFDQEIEPDGALPADFTVVAGHRSISAASLSWSPESVTLTLDEQVTSLDAVVLRYAPGEGRSIRDRSHQELEAFELRAQNLTSAPISIAERVAEAELRASSGTTTFAHELVRGFASLEGIRVSLASGNGWTRVARADLQVSVDASRIGAASTRIEVAPIDHLVTMLEQLETGASSCWNPDASDRFTAWWIGASDVHGVPGEDRIRVMLTGVFDPFHTARICVMNLATGDWRVHRPGRPMVAPALVLIHEIPVTISRDQLSLAG